ncbi:MAG: hypothetical protein RLY89_602, partial [Bacteroidota bacterium]
MLRQFYQIVTKLIFLITFNPNKTDLMRRIALCFLLITVTMANTMAQNIPNPKSHFGF